MDISWWHILVGFFFGNGMPHFLFGVAGKLFRSPLGANSSPKVNLYWGLINFVLGTVVAVFLAAGTSTMASWNGFFIGFWLVVAMFGFFMGHFRGDDV